MQVTFLLEEFNSGAARLHCRSMKTHDDSLKPLDGSTCPRFLKKAVDYLFHNPFFSFDITKLTQLKATNVDMNFNINRYHRVSFRLPRRSCRTG